MKLRYYAKRLAQEHKGGFIVLASIYNHLPFNNRFRLNGNHLSAGGAILRHCSVLVNGHGNSITIGGNCHLENSNVLINGNENRIVLGTHCSVTDVDFYIEDDGNTIRIGDETALCGKAHLACTEGKTIIVGEKCLFSSDIVIRTGDSHSILDSEGGRINRAGDVLISDRVWIGNRVIILKGVAIQHDSVVGSGSVVVKPFSETHIAIAGVPAKIVKRGISWIGERI